MAAQGLERVPWRPTGSHRGGPPLVFRFGCALVRTSSLFAADRLQLRLPGWWAPLLGQSSAPAGGSGLLIVAIVLIAAVAALLAFRWHPAVERSARRARRRGRADRARRLLGARLDRTWPASRSVRLARAFNEMSARLAHGRRGPPRVPRRRRPRAAHAAVDHLRPARGDRGRRLPGRRGASRAHPRPDRLLEQLIDDMRTVALAEAGGLTLKLAPTDLARRSTTRSPASRDRRRRTAFAWAPTTRPGCPRRWPTSRASARSSPTCCRTRCATRRRAATSPSRRGREGADGVEVAVRDEGAGIAAGAAADRLRPLREESQALAAAASGSAICRDLVEAHGGGSGSKLLRRGHDRDVHVAGGCKLESRRSERE